MKIIPKLEVFLKNGHCSQEKYFHVKQTGVKNRVAGFMHKTLNSVFKLSKKIAKGDY
jgi:hypothetical protein